MKWGTRIWKGWVGLAYERGDSHMEGVGGTCI